MKFLKRLLKIRFFISALFLTFLFVVILLFFRGNISETFATTLSRLYIIFLSFSFCVFSISAAGILDILSILRYVKKMSEALQRVARGDFDVKISLKRDDEIGELARNLEWMKDELKKNFEALEKEEEKMSAIIENVGDSIILIDDTRKIIFLNSAAEKLTGYKEEDAENKEYFNILKLFDKEKQVYICDVAHGFNESCPIEKAIRSDITIKLPKGIYLIDKYERRVEIDGGISPFREPTTKIKNYLIVFRDVTSEREIERMKSEFISITSHQLRTPLASIRWYVEMLLEGDAGQLNTSQKDYASEVHQSTRKAIELINNLLDVSRIEGGTVKYTLKPVQIEDVINDVVKDISVLAKASNVKIVKNFKGKILPSIKADYQKLFQVIQNIVVNAINYSKGRGEVIISLAKKDNNIIFSCVDFGIGVPREQQKDMFRKFFRATNAANTGVQGSGIGLFICKVFMGEMGGKIWFESEGENKGTTFYLSLPIGDKSL